MPVSFADVHHIVLQSLQIGGSGPNGRSPHPFFENNLVDKSWINNSKNLINLTNDFTAAQTSNTPRHGGAHNWINDGQRALFDAFMNRDYGGYTPAQLAQNPSLNQIAYQQMRADARVTDTPCVFKCWPKKFL
jgi:hypothetical protein